MRNLRDIIVLVLLGILVALVLIAIVVIFANQEIRNAETGHQESSYRSAE